MNNTPKPGRKKKDPIQVYENELRKQLFQEEIERLKGKEEDKEESPYYEDNPSMVHRKRKGEWDVEKDEEIRYFDPKLSYELTGYRPINMVDGKDFDPKPFREVAEVYERTKSFTEYPPGSKPYQDFWREQLRRCVEGYTIGRYRITGDHYFFLNFYRMSTVITDSTKQVSGRDESFPSFLAKQYEFFHYVEMCEYLGKDVVLLKARGLELTWACHWK